MTGSIMIDDYMRDTRDGFQIVEIFSIQHKRQ